MPFAMWTPLIIAILFLRIKFSPVRVVFITHKGGGDSEFTADSDYRTKRNGTQVFKISTDFQKETGLSYNYSVVTITCARAFFFLPLLRCCHVPKQQIVGARLSRGKVWSFLKKQLPALCFCRNEHRRTNAHFKAAVIFPRQLGPGMSWTSTAQPPGRVALHQSVGSCAVRNCLERTKLNSGEMINIKPVSEVIKMGRVLWFGV